MKIHPALNKVVDGFIEAMYFADGDEDGEDYSRINRDAPVTSKCVNDIAEYCSKVLHGLPESVAALDADRIGNCIYYHTMGHGTGFYDDLSLSDDDLKTIDAVFDKYACEVYSTESHTYFTFREK